MMEKTPIVIDFDGTIYEHKFPDIGEPTPGVKEALETLKRLVPNYHPYLQDGIVLERHNSK